MLAGVVTTQRVGLSASSAPAERFAVAPRRRDADVARAIFHSAGHRPAACSDYFFFLGPQPGGTTVTAARRAADRRCINQSR
jgi:hypothetical protein